MDGRGAIAVVPLLTGRAELVSGASVRRRWATTVVEQALRRSAEECESRGRLRMLTVLIRHLSTERIAISYAERLTAISSAASAGPGLPSEGRSMKKNGILG